MSIDLKPTISREAGPDTVARVVFWSRENDFRETFDGFSTRGDATDFVERLAPFIRSDVRATVEVVESTTYARED